MLTHRTNVHAVAQDYVYSLGFGPRTRNHESLAELLVGFFHYFAYNFDYHEVCVV